MRRVAGWDVAPGRGAPSRTIAETNVVGVTGASTGGTSVTVGKVMGRILHPAKLTSIGVEPGS